MKQIIPFNQAKAGKKPLFCLQNVRLGFGIAAKYPNAITAWNNTEQHKDRNVPDGLDVPLYYSWKVDGHINVRLANGTVWSDGNIYRSIADYEAKSAPVYLGWGESVNNVKVIGENIVNDKADYNFVKELSGTVLLRKTPMSEAEYNQFHKGKTRIEVYSQFANAKEAQEARAKLHSPTAGGNYVAVGQLYVKE